MWVKKETLTLCQDFDFYILHLSIKTFKRRRSSEKNRAMPLLKSREGKELKETEKYCCRCQNMNNRMNRKGQRKDVSNGKSKEGYENKALFLMSPTNCWASCKLG